MKKVKKKVKLKNIIIVLIVLITVSLTVYWYLNRHITNIFVNGNNYYSEQEIIDIAELSDYPKRKDISRSSIKELLLKDSLIKEANVSINILGQVRINIQEHRILVYDELYNKYIIDNGEKIKIDNINGIPLLINIIDEKVYPKFVKAFNKVDVDILNKVSEIKYDKNDIDDERFLLLMNDERYVYVTLTKIENLNNYNDIVEKLDDKLGILYLDSGNHFVIKGEEE